MGRWYRLVDGPVPRAGYEALGLAIASRGPLPKYDGSMDGRVGLFYTYGDHHERSRNHVWLHSVDDEYPGPACVGGVFVWETFALEAK